MFYWIDAVTKEVTLVQREREGRQNRYYWLSHQRFEGSTLPERGDERVVAIPVEELVDTSEATEVTDIQSLWDKYEEKFGKWVPARYKNDKERLLSKLAE